MHSPGCICAACVAQRGEAAAPQFKGGAKAMRVEGGLMIEFNLGLVGAVDMTFRIAMVDAAGRDLVAKIEECLAVGPRIEIVKGGIH